MKARIGCVYNNNGSWYARWQVNGVRYTKPTFATTKDEALKKLDELTLPYRFTDEADVADNLARRAAKLRDKAQGLLGSLRLDALWAEVEKDHPHWEEVTFRNNKAKVCAFVDWMKKAHSDVEEVREVTVKQGDEFLHHLETLHKSSKTRIEYRAVLLQAFDLTKSESRIKENIWKATRRPLNESQRKEALTRTQVAKLFSTLRDMDSCLDPWEFRCLFTLGAYTGMRLGDCCLLKWDAIDLSSGIIKATPNKTKRFGTTVELGIHPALQAVLLEAPTRKGYVLPDIAERHKRCHVSIDKKVLRVFREAGIETNRDNGNGRRTAVYGFHSLRHTFISESLNNGVPLPTVQAIVGHLSPEMSQHYYHASPTILKQAVKALPDYAIAEEESALDVKIKALKSFVKDWTKEEVLAAIKALQEAS